MTTTKLILFGPPRLEHADQPVDVGRRKSLAMLAYLGATNRPHSRDTLATLFWPEVSQSRAKGNLRRTLSELNQLLQEGLLVLEGDNISLPENKQLWIDVNRFRACLATCETHHHPPEETCPACLPLLEEVATLYQADFMAGFTLRDTPEFDDWQYFEAEGLRQTYAAALERLVNGLSTQADYQSAIPHGRRWVMLDPLHEPAQQQLMRLYALAGRRHEALRQYKVCAEVLETELGGTPSPETEAIYRQIVDGEVTPAAPAVPKSAWLPPTPIVVEVEHSAPLAGREPELEAIRAKIDAIRHGQGETMMLAGIAGVGKTRLAYEALRAAAPTGIITLMGAAYEQEGNLAYQPFIEAIDRYLTEHNRSPEENPITHYKPMGVTDLQRENTALFKATAAFLTNLTSEAPVVLLVDDLHAADEATLSMFHFLARQTRSSPFFILATYRTDVPLNNLAPFGSLLNALYRERLSTVLYLKPLSAAAGETIIKHTLNGEADPALITAIYEVAEGNPFFIQEITWAMLKDGQLFEDQETWRLPPGASLRVPAELRELLRERVQRLGATTESALTTAAVVGREFRFAILSSITQLADGELFDALDEALSAHLIEETETGYRFQHSLIRRTLYDSLSRRRRAWLHTRTGDAIEALYNERPEGLTPQIEALAYHYELSDRRDKALPYLIRAGQKATAVFALEVANDYLERASALMDELGVDDPAQRWAILEQLGSLAKILADTTRAITHYQNALALPFQTNPHTTQNGWQPKIGDRVRLHRSIARCFITAGQGIKAEDHLENAMEMMADTGPATIDYAHLLYDVALWHWHDNKYQDAYEAAQRSLDVAEQLNDNQAKAQAYEMLALACHSLGEWQQGLDFEQKRSAIIGSNLDVTEAFDAHL